MTTPPAAIVSDQCPCGRAHRPLSALLLLAVHAKFLLQRPQHVRPVLVQRNLSNLRVDANIRRRTTDLARFVRQRDAHEERYGHDPGYALVVLDDFDAASAADVSSLHGAWEKERPVLRYEGDTYDLSGLVFMTVFRGEVLARDARRDGWKAAIEAFYERKTLEEGVSGGTSSLTPAAAVGRMSGGVVLRALAVDGVVGTGIPADCAFTLPGVECL